MMLDRQTDRQTLISVIIPVYNVESYLRECLDSVLAQTFTDFELLLIDDGSPDGSGGICDEYARRDSRVRVFHQKNAGQAAARNFGVTQAAAKWIAFVDSDDVVHPQYLELLYQGIKTYNVRISLCGYVKDSDVPEDFLRKSFEFRSELRELTAEGYYNAFREDKLLDQVVWRMIIAKGILETYPFENGRIHEDSAIVCHWMKSEGRMVFSGTPLYFYRENPAGTMLRSKWDVKHIDQLWAYNRMLDCYQSMGCDAMVKVRGRGGVLSCREYYMAYKTVVPDKRAAGRVRKEFYEMERKYWDVIDLTDDERDWVLVVFHPWKFYFHLFRKKAADEGVFTLFKKCLAKGFGKVFGR